MASSTGLTCFPLTLSVAVCRHRRRCAQVVHASDRVADADGGDRLRRGVFESSPGQADLRAEHGFYLQPFGMAAKETAGVFPQIRGVNNIVVVLLFFLFFFVVFVGNLRGRKKSMATKKGSIICRQNRPLLLVRVIPNS